MNAHHSRIREEPPRVVGVLEGEAKDADKLRAAQLLLDRVGVGPHSSSDVNVSSDLERWIAELDEEAHKATVVALREVQSDESADLGSPTRSTLKFFL